MIINPILKGFHPDPSIVRVGEDYYIATSTFEWFPGVRIHHSRDLKNWRALTYVLTRSSQLNMEGNPDSCGVWAPCLSYDNGMFYLVYTDVKSRLGAFKDTHNYMVTAEHIEGPWSDPIYLNSSGFDPSLFHDDDGRKWLVNLLWDHREGRNSFAGIVLQELSMEQMKLIGERKNIFLGTELGCTEAPHVYKKNGYYYLMTAEGGTSYMHAVTIARATSIEGPYEVDPTNPIMTSAGQNDLLLQKAGHGSLVETPNGDWAMVYLVGRPINGYSCTLGRETAIERMEWTVDGWLRIAGGGNSPRVEVDSFNLPEHSFTKDAEIDHFDGEKLGIHWNTLRLPPDPSWLSFTERPGYLRLRGRESLSSFHRQSLIARRQESFFIEAETELEFQPVNFQQMAGLILYYDTQDYVYLRISHDEKYKKCLGLVRSYQGKWEEIPNAEVSIEGAVSCKLKAVIHADKASFYYYIEGEDWKQIGPGLDILHLADETTEANGFVRFTGSFIGLCVQDLSGMYQPADFKYFRYTEKDGELLNEDLRAAKVCHVSFTEDTRLGELLSSKAAAEVLEKYLPGISNNPMISMAKSLTLRQLSNIPQANFSEEIVKKIVTDLHVL